MNTNLFISLVNASTGLPVNNKWFKFGKIALISILKHSIEQCAPIWGKVETNMMIQITNTPEQATENLTEDYIFKETSYLWIS